MYWKLASLGILNILDTKKVAYTGYLLPSFKELYSMDFDTESGVPINMLVSFAHACTVMNQKIPVCYSYDSGVGLLAHVRSQNTASMKALEFFKRAQDKLSTISIKPTNSELPSWVYNHLDALRKFVAEPQGSYPMVAWPNCPDKDCNTFYRSGSILKGIGPYKDRVYLIEDEVTNQLGENQHKMEMLIKMIE